MLTTADSEHDSLRQHGPTSSNKVRKGEPGADGKNPHFTEELFVTLHMPEMASPAIKRVILRRSSVSHDDEAKDEVS